MIISRGGNSRLFSCTLYGMKKLFLLSVLMTFSFQVTVHGQWKEKELTLTEILKESKADLIFVGSVGGYRRSYSPNGRGDSTHATYAVNKVLKGKLTSNSVSLIYLGHIGFGEGDVIVFATLDRTRVDKEGRVNCPDATCFYTDVGWYLSYSRANEARVVRALKRKEK